MSKKSVWKGLSFIKLWAILTLLCCVVCLASGYHLGTKRETITKVVIEKVNPEECKHEFLLIEDYIIGKQTWFRTENHVRIEGSEYTRNLTMNIWECSVCGGKGATRFLTNPIEGKVDLTVEYARSEIEKAKAEKE